MSGRMLLFGFLKMKDMAVADWYSSCSRYTFMILITLLVLSIVQYLPPE